ncbi:MAG: hypothetical protein ACO3FQ_07605, partial [Terrimicrobiaceae bacterium]
MSFTHSCHSSGQSSNFIACRTIDPRPPLSRGKNLAAARSTPPENRPRTPLDSEAVHLSTPPSMLTIRNLKKSHGGRLLFEDADMQVNYG